MATAETGDAIAERNHRQRRGQRETEPRRQRPQQPRAQRSERDRDLAAGRAGQELAEGDDIDVTGLIRASGGGSTSSARK